MSQRSRKYYHWNICLFITIYFFSISYNYYYVLYYDA